MTLRHRNEAIAAMFWRKAGGLGKHLQLVTVYPLSKYFPRKKQQWAFGHSNNLFAGNQKYLFIWMSRNCPDIRVIWVSGDKTVTDFLTANGYSAARRYSLTGILAALRSKVFVCGHSITDVNFYLSRGAFAVNLCHGVGLKKIGRSVGEGVNSTLRKKKFLHAFRNYPTRKPSDLVVVTSDAMQTHFSNMYERSPGVTPKLGYSRLDMAFDQDLRNCVIDLDAKQGFRFNSEGFDRVFLYMPTFRDSQRKIFSEAILDINALSQVLAERNALLYIKPHPHTREPVPECENIRRWPANIDAQAYLTEIDELITDYSSVVYDYIFLTKKLPILYVWDYDRYISEDRGLTASLQDNTVGRWVTTFEEFCVSLRDDEAYGPRAKKMERINELCNYFWGSVDGPICASLVNYVVEAAKEHPET